LPDHEPATLSKAGSAEAGAMATTVINSEHRNIRRMIVRFVCSNLRPLFRMLPRRGLTARGRLPK
jgi:hypothetical protein